MRTVPRETYEELLHAAQDVAHWVEAHAQAAYEARRRTGPVRDADAAPWRRHMPRYAADRCGLGGAGRQAARVESEVRYKKRPPPGSVADLILRFRDSQRYRSWTPTTRARRDAVLANFMRMNGRMPIRDLRRADVIQMRDSLGDTPAAANNFLKALRTLLDYGLDLELVEQNVARLVKDLPPRHRHGYRGWREYEIDAFLGYWQSGSVAHLALTIMLYNGAARIDAVRLGPGNIRGDRIEYRRAKTE